MEQDADDDARAKCAEVFSEEILQFFKSYGKRRRKSAKIIDNIERD